MCHRRAISTAPVFRVASSRVHVLAIKPRIPAVWPSARGRQGRARVVISPIAFDLLSCGREHVPSRAEVVQVLARRLPRGAVADVVVERMSRVSDLRGSVGMKALHDPLLAF